MRNTALILSLSMALFLASCGWHLRGLEPLPEDLATLHLSTPYAAQELHQSLARSLKVAGVKLVKIATDAPYTLAVLDEKIDRRTITTSARAKTAEYQLTSVVTYEIRDNTGKRLAGPETLRGEKVFVFDRDNIVGTFEEEQLLKDEIRRDLVARIIRRYRALSFSQDESKESAELK